MTADEFDRLALEERAARAVARAVSERAALPKPAGKTRRSAGRGLVGVLDEARAALFRGIIERAVADGASEMEVYLAIQRAAMPQ